MQMFLIFSSAAGSGYDSGVDASPSMILTPNSASLAGTPYSNGQGTPGSGLLQDLGTNTVTAPFLEL